MRADVFDIRQVAKKFDGTPLGRAVTFAICALFFGVGFFVWFGNVREFWGSIVIDDAYITYRYAQNLAMGHGAVWNPGEAPVEGYSTPLFMLLLALGSLVANIETVSLVLCIGSTFAMVGLTAFWVFDRSRSPIAAALAAALLLAHPYTSVWSVGGMETPFYAALLMAVLLLGARFFREPDSKGRALGLAIALGAIGLARTEGMIFSAAFGATVLLEPKARRAGFRILVIAGTMIGAHVVMRLVYYGALLPAPAYQKSGELLAGWNYVHTTVMSYWPFLAVSLAGAFATAAKVEDRAPALFGLLCVLILGAVIANTEPLMTPYHRYLFPLLPVLFGFSAVAMHRLTQVREKRFLLPLFVGLVWLSDGASAIGASYEETAERIHLHSRTLRLSHVGAGEWLRENVPEGQLVAVGDCGLIPFFSGSHVVDLFGLNDYRIARTWGDHRISQEGVDYVFERDPAIVILTPLALDDPLEQDPRFAERYRFETVIHGFYDLGIFVRR